MLVSILSQREKDIIPCPFLKTGDVSLCININGLTCVGSFSSAARPRPHINLNANNYLYYVERRSGEKPDMILFVCFGETSFRH